LREGAYTRYPLRTLFESRSHVMTVPAAPDFGAPCPAYPSHETLTLMSRRRSASAQTLRAPAPSDGQLADLLRLAARVPDHGKMQPWRFVILGGEHKAAFVDRLRALAAARPDAAKAEAALVKIAAPPLCVAVVSSTREGGKPKWEQELSAGAVCMNLLLAADAMGFGANWITDWYGYDRQALDVLGLSPVETLAGWIMLGTPAEPPLERVRPVMDAIVTTWTG